MYFVIRNSDGDTHVDRIDQEELERRLNERYYGDHAQFLTSLSHSDTNYWAEDAILIIKGDIVTPTPQEVITRYVVD